MEDSDETPDNLNSKLPVVGLSAKQIATRQLAQAGKSALFDIGAKNRSLANLKPGSVTIRTPEMIDTIVQRLLGGDSLLTICSDPAMPAHETVTVWMRNDHQLSALIDWARSEGMNVLFDAQLDIAAGGYFSTGDKERDAMLIKAINNVASKRNRIAFGDRVDIQKTVINYTVKKDSEDW